eukprot:CAMPEP_0174960582 /NCGR_PEP_ID=MMETSP0004_2-20121128/3779_1 /TAXON_ID=420556 /ORGANISM="Ochromonas sp., Strain CCMP1393" /LENGTH=715 /DNA_ID=CAMNT_0016208961 /DNA_START=51 /DNA_END=2201 /DNA_ORIENTATION=+
MTKIVHFVRGNQKVKAAIPLSHPVVAIVGGGAAGYFSAIECARALQEAKLPTPYRVVVFEAGKTVLSKVLISGGGRCNVMHNPYKGPDVISQGYPRGQQELLGPLHNRFGPWDTFDWFSSRLPAGVMLKTEADGRVFPSTDSSTTIKEILQAAAAEANVEIISGAKVNSVNALTASEVDDIDGVEGAEGLAVNNTMGFRFRVGFKPPRSLTAVQAPRAPVATHFDGVQAPKPDANDGTSSSTISGSSISSSREECFLLCHSVILATGSSRQGYSMAEQLGHSLQSPLPSLFSFKVTSNPALTALSGVSTPYARVRLVVPKEFRTGPHKQLLRAFNRQSGRGGGDGGGDAFATGGQHPLTQRGPLLITQQGFSGPTVLKLSAFGAKVLAAMNYKFDIEVSWLGDLHWQDVFEHLKSAKKNHPNRSLAKCFPHLTPDMLAFLRENSSGRTTDSGEVGDASSWQFDAATSDAAVASDAAANAYGTEDVENMRAGGELTGSGNIIPRRLWLYILQHRLNLLTTTTTATTPSIPKQPTKRYSDKRGNKNIRDRTSGRKQTNKNKSSSKEEDGDGNGQALCWGQVKDKTLERIARELTGSHIPVLTTTTTTTTSISTAVEGETDPTPPPPLPLPPSPFYACAGRGQYRDEFVTCGGVPLREVSFKSMESKKTKGLYLTGEILDIDGITGGYNFQSAWTTGFIAGNSCAQHIQQLADTEKEA